MKVYAIVLGAGSGKRMGASVNKVFLDIESVPVIIRSIRAFINCCDGAIVVASAEEMETMQSLIDNYQLTGFVKCVVAGGTERQDSVCNALNALPEDADYVMIHDGARALVTEEVLTRAMAGAERYGSGIAAIPVVDTIKKADDTGKVITTPNRSELFSVQTPQVFRVDIIKKAHEYAKKQQYIGTDDASLAEYAGYDVYLTEGSRQNIKLTTPVDMTIAQVILHQRQKPEGKL